MKTRSLGKITLGITTEIIYALLIISTAFIACLVFYGISGKYTIFF